MLLYSSPPLFPLESSTHPLVAPLLGLLALERRFPRPQGWPQQRWTAIREVRVALDAISNPANAAALGRDLVTTAAAIASLWPYIHSECILTLSQGEQ